MIQIKKKKIIYTGELKNKVIIHNIKSTLYLYYSFIFLFY